MNIHSGIQFALLIAIPCKNHHLHCPQLSALAERIGALKKVLVEVLLIPEMNGEMKHD
jgi:hypothetical protein